MRVSSTIAVIFVILGFTLGSLINVASATEQAFAEPCPMQDQGDCPCCKGDCTPAMMGCSQHCAVPMTAADLPIVWKLGATALGHPVSRAELHYDPFIAGPPPPIPIL
jgi:hypothetical protein